MLKRRLGNVKLFTIIYLVQTAFLIWFQTFICFIKPIYLNIFAVNSYLRLERLAVYGDARVLRNLAAKFVGVYRHKLRCA